MCICIHIYSEKIYASSKLHIQYITEAHHALSAFCPKLGSAPHCANRSATAMPSSVARGYSWTRSQLRQQLHTIAIFISIYTPIHEHWYMFDRCGRVLYKISYYTITSSYYHTRRNDQNLIEFVKSNCSMLYTEDLQIVDFCWYVHHC